MKQFIVLFASLLLFFLVFATVVKAITYTYPYYSDVQADHGIFTYGCIPRPGTTGGDWFILNNATHESENCTNIITYSDHIQVNLNNEYDQVIVGYCVPDEVFAREGITPGVQMALGYFSVYLYDRDGNLVDPTTLTSSGDWVSANLWCFSRGSD